MIRNKTIVGLVITTLVLSCVAVAVTADEGKVEPMAIFPDSITNTEIQDSTVRNDEIANADTFEFGAIHVGTSYNEFIVAASGAITVAAGEGLDTTGSGTLDLGYTNATSILIGTTAATDIDIGAGAALARSIDIGTGTNIDTIKIGTGGTGLDDIDIGDALADVDITGASQIVAGTGDPLTITGNASSTWKLTDGALIITNDGEADADDLTISTSGAGDLVINAADTLDIDANTAITIDTATTMNLTSAGMTLEAGTTGALDIDAGAAITIDTDSTGAGITIQSTGANDVADVTLQTTSADADVIIATGDDFTLSATSDAAAVSIADGTNVHAITIGTDDTPVNTIGIGGTNSVTTFKGTVNIPGGSIPHLLNYSAAEVNVGSETEILNTTTGSDTITLDSETDLLITYSAEVTNVGGVTCDVDISKVCILSNTGAHVATATPESVTIADEYNYGLYRTVTFFVENVAAGDINVNVTATSSSGTSTIAQQTLTVIAV